MNTNTKQIEINADFLLAFQTINTTNRNIFITGKAGTGKSTLLEYFRLRTKKNIVVLAPTGVSALNVKGQTIHSFFRFTPTITPEDIVRKKYPKKMVELIKRVDTIVIDEVSMVRSDLMDCIDIALKHILNCGEPFGGIQMVLIGDLYQLPPVVVGLDEKNHFRTYYQSPYFFDSKVFQNFQIDRLELGKIYRQSDDRFINLLNKIRNNEVDEKDIVNLNSRYEPDFDDSESGDFYITLTTTNSAADQINAKKIMELGTEINNYKAVISGGFDKKHYPTSVDLDLRVGAQVMLLNNDSTGRWVNGSIGKIFDVGFDDDGEDILFIELSNGKKVKVKKHTWEVSRYFFNKEKNRLESEEIGSFTQYPVRLAWAVTIHKSQGKTFEKVIIDIGNGTFSHGQVYVAISRCTTFEGLVLRKPILKKHILMDYRVGKFLNYDE